MNIEDLKIGSNYSNEEVCEAFSCSLFSGMNKSNTTNTLVLINNHIKSIYDDIWDGDVLHYTGMGLTGNQVFKGNQNKTLYKYCSNGVKTHLFEVFNKGLYTYQGEFELYSKPYRENQDDINGDDRRVWKFPIRRIDGSTPFAKKEDLDKVFNRKLNKASKLSLDELRERAKKYPKKPGKRSTSSTDYQRNEWVIMYALTRANGVCELCEKDAPFNKKDGSAYLEVHHIKHLANDGDDIVENVAALCPNCHRKMHSLGLKLDIKKLQDIEN